MANYNYMFTYYGGHTQLIGSYMPIGYNSIFKYVDITLSHEAKTLGRLVTVAYWVCDNNFNINALEMDATKSNGPRYCATINPQKAQIKIINNIPYIDTNQIPENLIDTCRINFNKDTDGIKAGRIFIAIISTTSDSASYDYNDSSLKICMGPGSCYIKNNLNINDVYTNNNGGILFGKSLFKNLDGSSTNSDRSTLSKPSKIQCTDIRYRTWSDSNNSLSITTTGFNDNYTIAYADGGDKASDVSEYDTLKYMSNAGSGTIKTHIRNTKNNFENDFNIPVQRLGDVVYAAPNLEYYSSGTIDEAKEGRWVFKRSRIKFTIPPAKNSNGTVIDKAIVLRYRVVTALYDKQVYSTEYKTCTYSKADSKQAIELVICPRDEGVLDNMDFTVQLSRKYDGASGAWSDEANYKFRTYQKPTANIAYPKIIRNSATQNDFKYAKILTSNMYSNFTGENVNVNKYVCDALNILLATPMNDASDIPMYVRFYLAEYKYGRDGHLNSTGTEIDITNDTVQDLFKSQDPNKYITITDILTNNDGDKKTAYMTGIYKNDGQPILLSGRFTNQSLQNIGKDYKLWTYKDWDNVCGYSKVNGFGYDENKDVRVGNAWEVKDKTGNNLLDSIVGDHCGSPTVESDSEGNNIAATQRPSTLILFRAGYVYLLRIRLFHGACAGAIFKHYNSTTREQMIYGMTGSGEYDYHDATYNVPYPDNETVQYGELNPFNGFKGPEDGTSGLPLYKSSTEYNNKLKMTYSGFSEVDYTLIEPVCPYTSKSNLITVHPTSPEISANQWLSFNYRHLAKNSAGFDWNSTKWDESENKYETKNMVFGRSASGIQNTLTRMMSMYASCVETILHKYLTLRGNNPAIFYNNIMGTHTCSESSPTINYEKISLWIKPFNKRTLPIIDHNQDFVNAYPKVNDENQPLIFEFDIKNYNTSSIGNAGFYDQDSLLYLFNQYRLSTDESYDLSNLKESITNKPEMNIIYKKYNMQQQGSPSSYIGLDEPMGNVYRWQPVINAINISNNNVNEIQVEDKNIDEAKNYTIGSDTLRQTRTFSQDEVELLYAKPGDTSKDYDLQTKYFYKDEHTINAGSINFTNNSTNRFNIKEFCGIVTDPNGAKYSSGYPVMYSTSSKSTNSVYGGVQKNIKYFCINDNNIDDTGHLYSRVSSLQDCENGIPTPAGLSNIGNLSSKGAVTINTNENNAIPIVRTTHYLYFKTWIDVTFCMRIGVSLTGNYACTYDDEGEHSGHSTKTDIKDNENAFWYNGVNVVTDSYSVNPNNYRLLVDYPSSELRFGNENGFAEVYGEDNHGWGRCLSADDISNRQLKFDGSISTQKVTSGGLEVPIMVRYTPLLRPKLLAKKCYDIYGKKDKWLSLSSNTISLEKCKGTKTWNASLNDGTISDNSEFKQIKTGQLELKIAYPYIKETNNYGTVSPNGGHGGNVYFKDYFIDVDTDANRSIDQYATQNVNTNMDFFGGTGVCTSYTVILVPNNPTPQSGEEQYFINTDGHWNFYKQAANYFKGGSIFENCTSSTNSSAKPVLVAYNLQPEYENSCKYLDNNANVSIPSGFIDDRYIDDTFKGRNYQTIRLNFSDLRNGKFVYRTSTNVKSYKDASALLGFSLSEKNILQPGVIYDLIIIPNYSNITISDLDYNKSGGYGPGTINGNTPSGGVSEEFKSSGLSETGEVLLAGSNPLVLYNYFQIGNETEVNCEGGGGGPVPDPEPDPEIPDEPDPRYIQDSDSVIVFPNIDNVKFNINTGEIKEIPGFWLNNTFKLILRMPSFRTNETKYSDIDTNTIENMSQGALDSSNNANDFMFSDIQIHIGKINELEEFGYPDDMSINLNKLTSLEDLAKAHIISYSNYGHFSQGVFSKKLYEDEDNEDKRELLTAGSLDPTNEAYSNRFIEVNLSNAKIANEYGNLVPIYTLYPEGYYIQFRWKSAYPAVGEEDQWSDWYGGSYDGGLSWWGGHGLNYFVPVRNYSTIYTDFRNYINEAYPGSNENLIGKGSTDSAGSIDDNSKTKPKSGINPGFYNIGLGNHSSSLIVPSNQTLDIEESLTKHNISLKYNNDTAYLNEIQYKKSHDVNFESTGFIFNNHQNMWEILYIDYIIRNMCKLYYKPKYNKQDENYKLYNPGYTKLYYHSSTPFDNSEPLILNYLTWGWDDSEYKMFNQYELINTYKGQFNEKEFDEDKSYQNNKLLEYDENGNIKLQSIRTKGPNTITDRNIQQIDDREKWNRNKYYRRPITRQDFDELNKHLEQLTEFIRNSLFTGLNNDNKFLLDDILPVTIEDLQQFKRERHNIIGNSISNNSGLKNTWNSNNINNTMLSCNYVQTTWQNILSMCKPGSKLTEIPDPKTNYIIQN